MKVTNVKDLFHDYADHSTIHGITYIAEKGRSWIEKSWWITVLCISVTCCGKLIFDAWQINPIIIVFTDKPTPIWQIPFPAITICPLTFARGDRINITNLILHRMDGKNLFRNLTEREKIQAVGKYTMCSEGRWVEEFLTYINCNECLAALREIRIPPEEMFVKCKFRNRMINCRDAFIETIINYHLCYTFNELGIYRQNSANDRTMKEPNGEWSIDEGFKRGASIDAYPYRALGAGPTFGFSILMRSDKTHFDKFCTVGEGFAVQSIFSNYPDMEPRVEYRTPFESPQFSPRYLQFTMKDSINLIVTPELMITSDELRDYSPTKRKCFFSNEKRLKYFKQYTQSNCEIECHVEATVRHCGCLPIYIESQRGKDICGPPLHQCIATSKEGLIVNNYVQCNCLPACSSITFDAEVSVTKLNESILPNLAQYEYTEVNIFFKEKQFLTRQRAELYGNIDFLANCGGLLGLFLGVSVKDEIEDRSETVSVKEFQAKSNRYLKLVKALIDDYSSKATIQGINYIADSSLTLIERIWWTLIGVFSIFCCGSLIADTYRQYDESPVIVSYESEETPITRIPFPAVTVCPQIIFQWLPTMFDYYKVQNLSLYNLDAESIKTSAAVAQVCDSGIFNDIDPDNKTDCEQCADQLKWLMGDANNAFDYCLHIGGQNICLEMFRKVVTEGGVCYVYNSLEVFRSFNEANDDVIDEWTLEGGYKQQTAHIDIHPRAGSKSALAIGMDVNQHMIDGICKNASQAFKVYLHLPIEHPQTAKQFILMPYYYFTQVLITPKVTFTEPELRDLSVTKRQCYFSDERYLRFFRHYTQNNCEIECLANMTLGKCGCLVFFMPKIPGVKICGMSDIKCYQMVADQNIGENEDNSSSCHCMATCTSISYDTEINPVRLSNGISSARMDVAFRDNQFVALKRSQLFGKTEFLANIGGLLGLFLGFSIVSIMELIYFCIFRFFFDLKTEFLNKREQFKVKN